MRDFTDDTIIFFFLQPSKAMQQQYVFTLPVRKCVSPLYVKNSNKITVTIFTMFGGGGALGLGEPLENRVWPLVEGGEMKCLETVYGQAEKKR